MKNILGNANFGFKNRIARMALLRSEPRRLGRSFGGLRASLLLALTVGWMGAAQAQVPFTGTYTFGSDGNVVSFAYNGTAITDLTVSALTKVGVTSSISSGNSRASNWGTGSTDGGAIGGSLDAGKYFEFTITAGGGFTITDPTISFGVGRSGTGPRQFEWRSSLDNYATAILVTANNASVTKTAGNVLQTPDASSGYTGNTVSLTTSGQSAITFRFYAYGAEQTGGTGGLQGNLTFSGSLVSSGGGTAPTISSFSPSSGAVGASVTINGSNFGASPVVKFNGTTATSSVNAGGTQITATVPAGATSGKITVEVAGQTTATSATDFTVVAAGAPLVVVSPTSATGLTNYVGQASAPTNYTVTGTNLGGTNLVVTASTNAIEVSTNSSTGFTNSFSLAPSVDGTLSNTVYVRISALAPTGAVSATVSNVSGVASNNFTVSGTVTQPALTLVLATNSVAENAGANATTGTVGIPASLGTDLVVNLVSTNTAAATVPSTVTITNGQTNATFDIAAVSSSGSYQPQTTAIQASNSNYTTASATLTVTNVDVPTAPLAVKGWINEFHYDNADTDSGEFVEIVLAPGTSTSNVSVVLYNGYGGKPYTTGTPAQSTFPLSQFVAGGSSNGFLIYSLAIPGIQNGGPDGLVLIIDGVPEDLVSYEGSFAATDGLAAGYTLPDIGIAQTGTEAVGSSLYRYGPGNTGRDFAWAKAAVATPGQVNPGQNLGATAVQGTGTLAIANTTASSPFLTQNIFPKATVGQTVSLTLTGTLSSGTISSMSVVVPAAFTELSVGNVTVSGTGAGTPVTTLRGSTLTVTGLVVDQLNPVTINIAGLTTPETAGDLTKDGNYPFTVQTGVDGNLQSLLIQPIAVVTIPIANLGDVDANGVSLDEGKTVAVQGVCTEENFNSTFSTSAYLQSGQPDGILKAGINIYSGQRSLFVRGNEYVVTGSVLNYKGLTELVVEASSQVVGLGTATTVPTPVTLTIDQLTAAHEAYEGSLVRVVGLSKVSGTWALTVVGTTTSGSNVILANGGVNLTARLNAGSTALAEPIYPTAITGIYGQFVAGSPYTGGGQIQPRDQADIEDAPGLRLTLGFNQINEGGDYTSETLTISRTGGSVGSVSGVLSAGTLGKIQVMEGGVAQQLPYSFTIADGVDSTTLTIEAIDNLVYGGNVDVVLTATDSASSNPLSSASVTVTVLENEAVPAPDTTKPVITLLGANPLLMANGATYTDPGAKVTDNVDAERTITGSGTVNTAVQGDYTVTYNATDAAGNVADAVTRTVRVAAPVVVESNYAEWSGGATLDSAGLAKYAIGGASSLTANDGVKPTTALTGGFLVITAIVRTDNSDLTLVGQAVTDLANYASGTGVTTVNGVETTDQTGVPTGHKRKTFSVAQGSDAKKFMCLSASLALSGVNTTVSVARDSGGATFLQVTGATAGATGGGTATSDKRSIYYFTPDTTSSPTFSGGSWPYVIVQGQLSAGAGVTATLTKNGSGMLLVNGLPAYQFGGDSGSTTANGVGGTWPGMRADGTKTTTGPSGTLQ